MHPGKELCPLSGSHTRPGFSPQNIPRLLAFPVSCLLFYSLGILPLKSQHHHTVSHSLTYLSGSMLRTTYPSSALIHCSLSDSNASIIRIQGIGTLHRTTSFSKPSPLLAPLSTIHVRHHITQSATNLNHSAHLPPPTIMKETVTTICNFPKRWSKIKACRQQYGTASRQHVDCVFAGLGPANISHPLLFSLVHCTFHAPTDRSL